MSAPYNGILIQAAAASGLIIVCDEGLSVWGDVDPASGEIIDALHPQFGANIARNHAHYGPSLTGCTMQFGSPADCAAAALSGQAPSLPVF